MILLLSIFVCLLARVHAADTCCTPDSYSLAYLSERVSGGPLGDLIYGRQTFANNFLGVGTFANVDQFAFSEKNFSASIFHSQRVSVTAPPYFYTFDSFPALFGPESCWDCERSNATLRWADIHCQNANKASPVQFAFTPGTRVSALRFVEFSNQTSGDFMIQERTVRLFARAADSPNTCYPMSTSTQSFQKLAGPAQISMTTDTYQVSLEALPAIRIPKECLQKCKLPPGINNK